MPPSGFQCQPPPAPLFLHRATYQPHVHQARLRGACNYSEEVPELVLIHCPPCILEAREGKARCACPEPLMLINPGLSPEVLKPGKFGWDSALQAGKRQDASSRCARPAPTSALLLRSALYWRCLSRLHVGFAAMVDSAVAEAGACSSVPAPGKWGTALDFGTRVVERKELAVKGFPKGLGVKQVCCRQQPCEVGRFLIVASQVRDLRIGDQQGIHDYLRWRGGRDCCTPADRIWRVAFWDAPLY